MKPDRGALNGAYSHSDFLPQDDSKQDLNSSKVSRNRKTLALAGLVVLLIAGLAIGLGVGLTRRGDRNSSNPPPPASNVPLNVQKLCAQTEFSDVCEPALSGLPGSATASDEQLVNMALKAAVNLLNSIFGLATSIAANSKDPKVKEAAALCQEILTESVDDLNITSISLDAIVSAQKPDDDGDAIAQLVHRVNAAATGNTDCANAIIDFSTAGNFTNATAEVNLAFQYASNTAMAMENAAVLIKKLPGLSAAIQAWQDKQQAIVRSGFNASILDAAVFGANNTGDDNGDGAGSRRLLRELALQEDDDTPSWVRRRLLQRFPKADVTVDAKGGGQFKKVQQAIDFSCDERKKGSIFIRPGKYVEKVVVPKKCFLTIFGSPSNVASTIISYDDNTAIKGIQTFATATFDGKGDNLVLAYLTIENTSGPEGHQAVALRLSGIRQAVYKCNIKGFQDTLYVHKGVHYIRETTISGTVDFIFGNGASFFDRCRIECRASSSKGTFDTITAQGRTAASQDTGLVFGSCVIVADGGLKRLLSRPGSYRVYMGRPWKPYSRTVFALSDFGSFLNDKHWVNWDGDEDSRLPKTVFYAEFQNKGRGYSTGRVIDGTIFLNRKTLRPFLITNFINGDSWLSKTGLPLN